MYIYKSQKYLEQFFAHTLFQILKKVYLQISKTPGTIFLLIPFFQIFKIPETIFQIFKKHTYKILKNLTQLFGYTLFEILKKVYLQISKILGTIFLLITFFKYLKKHTYKS